MLRALRKDSGASNEEDSKADGIKSKLAEKIRAPLKRLKKGGKPEAPQRATHKPVFAARNIPQGVALNGEASGRQYQSKPKRRKHERRETRTHREQQYGISARERDAEFLKHGPSELTSLYKPLSLNMSKTRKRPEEQIEYYGRYQFEELAFSSTFVLFLSLIPGPIEIRLTMSRSNWSCCYVQSSNTYNTTNER